MTSTDRHGHGGGGHSGADDNEAVDHERSDVNIRAILMSGVGLVVIVVACALIIRVVFGVLERQAAANDPQLSPLAVPAGRQPPEPTLVTNEPDRLAEFRAKEMKTLEGYGWVEEQAGVAHIPITEAKKLILERGLPVRSSGAVDPLEGTHAPATGEAAIKK